MEDTHSGYSLVSIVSSEDCSATSEPWEEGYLIEECYLCQSTTDILLHADDHRRVKRLLSACPTPAAERQLVLVSLICIDCLAAIGGRGGHDVLQDMERDPIQINVLSLLQESFLAQGRLDEALSTLLVYLDTPTYSCLRATLIPERPTEDGLCPPLWTACEESICNRRECRDNWRRLQKEVTSWDEKTVGGLPYLSTTHLILYPNLQPVFDIEVNRPEDTGEEKTDCYVGGLANWSWSLAKIACIHTTVSYPEEEVRYCSLCQACYPAMAMDGRVNCCAYCIQSADAVDILYLLATGTSAYDHLAANGAEVDEGNDADDDADSEEEERPRPLPPPPIDPSFGAAGVARVATLTATVASS